MPISFCISSELRLILSYRQCPDLNLIIFQVLEFSVTFLFSYQQWKLYVSHECQIVVFHPRLNSQHPNCVSHPFEVSALSCHCFCNYSCFFSFILSLVLKLLHVLILYITYACSYVIIIRYVCLISSPAFVITHVSQYYAQSYFVVIALSDSCISLWSLVVVVTACLSSRFVTSTCN